MAACFSARRITRATFAALLASAILLTPPASAPAGAASKIISGVPIYTWWYGCAPTSGGMIMGYWDSNGYGNLYAGDPTVYDAGTKALIASDDHVNQVAGHNLIGCAGVEDSISCFMETDPLPGPNFGGTSSNKIAPGLNDYATAMGHADLVHTADWTFTFADYKASIDADRPVELLVLSTTLGGHAVVGVGYIDNPVGTDYIYVHDTWGDNFGNPVDFYGNVGYDPTGGGQNASGEYWPWAVWTGTEADWAVFGGIVSNGGSGGGAGAPEPSTLLLLLTGGIALRFERRRSRGSGSPR